MIHGFQFQNPRQTPDDIMRPPGRGNFGPPQIPDRAHQTLRYQLNNILNAALGGGASEQWARRNQTFNKALVLGGLLGMAHPGSSGAKVAGRATSKLNTFGKTKDKWNTTDYRNLSKAKQTAQKHAGQPGEQQFQNTVEIYEGAKRHGLKTEDANTLAAFYRYENDIPANKALKSFDDVIDYWKSLKYYDLAKIRNNYHKPEMFDSFVEKILDDQNYLLYKLAR